MKRKSREREQNVFSIFEVAVKLDSERAFSQLQVEVRTFIFQSQPVRACQPNNLTRKGSLLRAWPSPLLSRNVPFLSYCLPKAHYRPLTTSRAQGRMVFPDSREVLAVGQC
jgi:hypothetical protein